MIGSNANVIALWNALSVWNFGNVPNPEGPTASPQVLGQTLSDFLTAAGFTITYSPPVTES